MTRLKQIALCLLCFVIVIRPDKDAVTYCKDNFCRGSNEHTYCKFSGPSPNCIDYQETIISQKDKQLIVDKINSRRNKVASGEIRSLPAAESMMKLEWNDDLALSAQRWADQCKDDNVNDTCRDLENTAVGQNIATIKGESPGLSPYVLADLWYIELLNFNASIISSYQSSLSAGLQHYDYFSQLVWGTTSAVGCGGVKFSEKEDKLGNQKETVYMLVCNFSPSGNHQGKKVYRAGEPCSKCPQNYACDFKFPSLCSKDIDEPEEHTAFSTIPNPSTVSTYSSSKMDQINNDTETTNGEKNRTSNNILLKEQQTDSADSFDLLSYLFEASTTSTETTPSATKCKDVIAVEEFIRILKNKLNSEQLVRDFLYSTKKSLDSSLADENVKAVVQQIYSKKMSSTTKSVTESNKMNSTLLANLVEAIIFRKSDSVSTTHNPYTETPTYNNIRPIKIQASLGEVKENNEFSGHLFFPEEDEGEENVESETSEPFYDSTDGPASDIAFEIEDISKNTRTRNFLDEVLEEELLKEGATEDNPTSTEKGVSVEYTIRIPYLGSYSRNIRRFKRKNTNNTQNYVITRKTGREIVYYFDLLKKIATDLRQLRLRKHHSCSSNNSDSNREHIFFTVTCIIMIQQF